MKLHFLLLLIFATASGCKNKPSASADPVENRYFRLYNEIYNQWGKEPADSTRQKLNAYLQEFPENAAAQMLAGNLAYSLADYEKAISSYRLAIALQPQQAVYYSALGTVYNVQQQTDSAEKYLMKALALQDSSPYTYLNVALLYAKTGNRQKSFAFADSAYTKGNTLPIVCSGLSFVFCEWKEAGKSNRLYEEAVTLGLKDTPAFKQVLNGKMPLEDYYRTSYMR